MKPNSQEKLNCSGDDERADHAEQRARQQRRPPAASDKPLNRLVSKYSPSGVGTIWERSLISLAPPGWLQVSAPAFGLRFSSSADASGGTSAAVAFWLRCKARR